MIKTDRWAQQWYSDQIFFYWFLCGRFCVQNVYISICGFWFEIHHQITVITTSTCHNVLFFSSFSGRFNQFETNKNRRRKNKENQTKLNKFLFAFCCHRFAVVHFYFDIQQIYCIFLLLLFLSFLYVLFDWKTRKRCLI